MGAAVSNCACIPNAQHTPRTCALQTCAAAVGPHKEIPLAVEATPHCDISGRQPEIKHSITSHGGIADSS